MKVAPVTEHLIAGVHLSLKQTVLTMLWTNTHSNLKSESMLSYLEEPVDGGVRETFEQCSLVQQ